MLKGERFKILKAEISNLKKPGKFYHRSLDVWLWT